MTTILEKKQELARLLEMKHSVLKYRKIDNLFPETGKYSRHLYKKHMALMEAGSEFRERLAMWANRTGKTETGGAEYYYHMSGKYPDWWKGRRINRPHEYWVAGNTTVSVRDIIQSKMLGEPGVPEKWGTGIIPLEDIHDWTNKRGVDNAVDTVFVKHYRPDGHGGWVQDGVSSLSFKSYEQGRKSFEGTAKAGIWLDEEPPLAIYTECLLRTMTTGGFILLTFTPLQGLTDVVMLFLPNKQIPKDGRDGKVGEHRFLSMATWDDAPHLDEATKRSMMDSLLPHQRDARARGIPSLGAGAIYPVDEDFITVEDFEIPKHWPRAFALDVAWNRTAALWIAWDRESDTAYLYSEHYLGKEEPAIHASAIRARGIWIPGVVDPAARGRAQTDGEQLITTYRFHGLELYLAENAVEAGIYEVWTMLKTGRLKVFKSCRNFFEEYRIYRRDENGKVIKQNDHLMDCMRYLVLAFRRIARVRPVSDIMDYVKKRQKKFRTAGKTHMSA